MPGVHQRGQRGKAGVRSFACSRSGSRVSKLAASCRLRPGLTAPHWFVQPSAVQIAAVKLLPCSDKLQGAPAQAATHRHRLQPLQQHTPVSGPAPCPPGSRCGVLLASVELVQRTSMSKPAACHAQGWAVQDRARQDRRAAHAVHLTLCTLKGAFKLHVLMPGACLHPWQASMLRALREHARPPAHPAAAACRARWRRHPPPRARRPAGPPGPARPAREPVWQTPACTASTARRPRRPQHLLCPRPSRRHQLPLQLLPWVPAQLVLWGARSRVQEPGLRV